MHFFARTLDKGLSLLREREDVSRKDVLSTEMARRKRFSGCCGRLYHARSQVREPGVRLSSGFDQARLTHEKDGKGIQKIVGGNTK